MRESSHPATASGNRRLGRKPGATYRRHMARIPVGFHQDLRAAGCEAAGPRRQPGLALPFLAEGSPGHKRSVIGMPSCGGCQPFWLPTAAVTDELRLLTYHRKSLVVV